MPATAGRVRMPANNRIHSSAALQTHEIWRSVIGYDPYAPTNDDSKAARPSNESEGDRDNTYANFKRRLKDARIVGADANETRGACGKCGSVGHFSFQCRNFLSFKDDDDKEKDPDAVRANVMEKTKRKLSGKSSVETSEVEDESESSDSSEDSEMERIIAERFGKRKKGGSKPKSGKKKKKDSSDNGDSDSGGRKKRGRSKKRSKKRSSKSNS